MKRTNTLWGDLVRRPIVSRRRYSPLDGKLDAGIIDVEVKHCESVAAMPARMRVLFDEKYNEETPPHFLACLFVGCGRYYSSACWSARFFRFGQGIHLISNCGSGWVM